jgi:hypothetical protein
MRGKADALRSNLAEPKASPGLDPGVASVKPKVVETKPKRPKKARKVAVDEDETDLIAAK